MAKYLGIRRYPEAANLYPGCWLSKALLVEALLPTQLGPGDHWWPLVTGWRLTAFDGRLVSKRHGNSAPVAPNFFCPCRVTCFGHQNPVRRCQKDVKRRCNPIMHHTLQKCASPCCPAWCSCCVWQCKGCRVGVGPIRHHVKSNGNVAFYSSVGPWFCTYHCVCSACTMATMRLRRETIVNCKGESSQTRLTVS